MRELLKGEFIRGTGNRDDRFIIILDIDRVFSTEEITSVHDMTGENERMAGKEWKIKDISCV